MGTVQMTLSKAHEAIGEYFCAFSNLERELGEAIKVVLRLQGNPAADAIVALIGDFARKAGVVREAIQTAKHVDGTDPDQVWKDNADDIMGKILGCNNPDRRDLAHDYLDPHPDGSVDLQKPGKDPKPWTTAEFDAKILKLKDFTIRLRTVTTELTTLRIPVPTGWMSMDTYQPRRTSSLPPGIGSGFTYTPRPPDPEKD